MTSRLLPKFPYGAVYFRKSNPPCEDWERDYGVAAEDGMNIFRHWFLWSAIEISPGVFDWEEYDRQFELAAANGMKTIVAEMITAAPSGHIANMPTLALETQEGHKLTSQIGGSALRAGFQDYAWIMTTTKLLLNDLRELATRYKGHAGLGGYDIWNECNIGPNVCYCPATMQKFRTWLKAKYGRSTHPGQSLASPQLC